MASPDRIDALIQHYLDGQASAVELGELAELLRQQPAAAAALAQAVRFEALLETHFVEHRATAELASETPRPTKSRAALIRIALPLAAAAAIALVMTFAWPGRDGAVAVSDTHRVISGRVLVDGVEATVIADGAQVEVLQSAPAVIQLTEGGEVQLAPESTARFRSDSQGPIVEVDYGNVRIRSRTADRSVRVVTPAGDVSGQNAEFAVGVQATAQSGASPMHTNLLALLTVAVMAGQVEVQDAGQKVKVAAGESRAFSPEKKPMFTGRVTAVSSDGKRLTLEGKPGKPGTPPQEREVQITGQTELSYFGVPKDGDRPTVGYQATAELDKAAPEKAVAIEFGEKTPQVVGRVKSVSDDAAKLTLEIFRKNDTPIERTVSLNERTRVSYTGVPPEAEKPTAGYQASVWLEKDSDLALEVRFLVKNKVPANVSEKDPPKKKPVPKEKEPAKPPAKPDAPKKKPNEKEKEPAKPQVKPDAPKKKSESDEKPAVKPASKDMARRVSTRDPFSVAAEIDAQLDRRLAEEKIPASPAADDAEFLRRATLDITGQIPTYLAARAFLADSDPAKRTRLIDELLSDPASGRRFAAVWKRLMSPRPANNGKPQVDKFTPWLAEQFNANRAWSDIVSELLTAEGDLVRDPQSYFLTASSEGLELKPNLLAAATARLFLGVQVGCAECHDHPFAPWKQTEFWSLAAFYSRVHKKSKSDWTLTEDSTGPAAPASITIPAGGKSAGVVVPARFLGGGERQLEPAAPLRPALAAWVTSADNPYFARSLVNRLWAHFFSRGLVEPLDGFQEGYQASHPEMLDRLAAEFVASGFEQQHLVRVICNTRAYGRTSRPLAENESDTQWRSHMAIKPLAADVLHDSLSIAVNASLQAPTVGKNGKLSLADPRSIGSRDQFINFFTPPASSASDTQYSHGIPQLLCLMNADAFNVGAPLAKEIARNEGTLDEKIETLYLAVLSRTPTAEEARLLGEYVNSRGGSEQAFAGVLWILLNTSEFVLNR